MATLADVITEARHFLQDAVVPYRQQDAELEMYLRDGFAELYFLRADIVPMATGACAAVPPDLSDMTALFPLNERWLRLLAMYVAGSAQLKDDEYAVSDNQGNYFLKRFGEAIGPGRVQRVAA